MDGIPVFAITSTIKHYDWGKVGLASAVAQLVCSSDPHFIVGQSTPYAELWMGTHPTSPSVLRGVPSIGQSDEPSPELSTHLAAHPYLLGTCVIEHGNLPFLFKVLSIEKALSIQTHPDKQFAEQLHVQHPQIYKDANHKPEMALALTPFRALCGFLPLERIHSYLCSTPEFASLIPEPIAAHFSSISHAPPSPASKVALKSLFSALMTADPSVIQTQLAALVSRYQRRGANSNEKDVADLVILLDSQFPGDIGVFCAFVLNYVDLQPGEAIFLGAGEPHAYISGDIIECMANSDNVIRAGLTPKLRDIPNLLAGLTYSSGPASRHMVEPELVPDSLLASDDRAVTMLYQPPVPEFSVYHTVLEPGAMTSHPSIDGPSIAIVTQGYGVVRWTGFDGRIDHLELKPGVAFFIGAGTAVSFKTKAEVETPPLHLYRAFTDEKEGRKDLRVK